MQQLVSGFAPSDVGCPALAPAPHVNSRALRFAGVWALLAASAVLVLPATAAGATTAKSLATIACEGLDPAGAEKRMDLESFAEAVVVSVGKRPSVERERAGSLVSAVFADGGTDFSQPVMEMYARFQANPAQAETLYKLRFEPAMPRGETFGWFKKNAATLEVVCLPRKVSQDRPSQAYIASFNDPTPIPRFNVGRTVDDLSAVDAKGLKSGESASIGFIRSRETTEANGQRTTKTSRKASVDATVGLRISGDLKPDPVFVYASYTLGQARANPAPTLKAGETERDSDTESFEAGLSASEFSLGDAIGFSAQAAFASNLVERNGRLTGRLVARPAFILPLGICNFGTFAYWGSMRSGCYVEGAMDGAVVTARGASKPDEFDDYLAIGGAIGWRVSPALADKGFVLDLRYSYLPVVAGPVRDFERFDASIAYRWWIADRYAVDIGPAYRRGTEVKSLEREDTLTLIFGILF